MATTPIPNSLIKTTVVLPLSLILVSFKIVKSSRYCNEMELWHRPQNVFVAFCFVFSGWFTNTVKTIPKQMFARQVKQADQPPLSLVGNRADWANSYDTPQIWVWGFLFDCFVLFFKTITEVQFFLLSSLFHLHLGTAVCNKLVLERQ